MVLEKAPPSDVEAEATVIAAVLVDEAALTRVRPESAGLAAFGLYQVSNWNSQSIGDP